MHTHIQLYTDQSPVLTAEAVFPLCTAQRDIEKGMPSTPCLFLQKGQ